MAWAEQTAKTPTSIGEVTVKIVNKDGLNVMRYFVVVLDQTGEVANIIIGDLADIVSGGRIQQAAGILSDVRTKAVTDLLP